MSTKQSPLPRQLSVTDIGLIQPLEPPLPPVFPSFQDLALENEIAARTPPTRHRMLDLFDGILGDLAPLLEDFSLHPEKYGPEQAALLERLASGSTSIERLSPSERLVLNLAVIEFTQPVPAAPEPKTKTASKREAKDEEEELDEYKDEEPTIRAGEVPETELPAHWWLRG